MCFLTGFERIIGCGGRPPSLRQRPSQKCKSVNTPVPPSFLRNSYQTNCDGPPHDLTMIVVPCSGQLPTTHRPMPCSGQKASMLGSCATQRATNSFGSLRIDHPHGMPRGTAKRFVARAAKKYTLFFYVLPPPSVFQGRKRKECLE